MAYENNIKKILEELEGYSDGKVLGDEYERYLLNINMLSNMIDQLNPKDGSHAPILSGKDINDLIGLYNRTFDWGAEFLAKASKEKSLGDKTFSIRKKLVKRAQGKLLENISALSAGAGAQNMTYEEVLAFAGGRVVNIDGDKLDTTGGAMSTRIPISFKVKGDNGEEIEEQGFFTEYGKLDLIRERDELINRVGEGSETLKEIFKAIFKNEKFYDDVKKDKNHFYLQHMKYGRAVGRKDETELAHLLFNDFSGYKNPQDAFISRSEEKVLSKIMKDIKTDLNQRIITFLREYPAIVNKYAIIYDRAKIVGNDSLEDRNAAMTTVAQILGCPEIVAKSTKMSISVGGKRKDGIFMEKAQGEDRRNLNPKSPLARIAAVEFVTPKGMSNLADLQILDFICGNVDRHTGNMTYKITDANVKTPELTCIDGFVGIDNDSAFGLIDGKARVMKLPSIDELGFINRKTADRILAMNPDTLGAALSRFKLDEQEIEAAKKRLKLIRNAIRSKTIEIVENNGWEKKSIEECCCVYGENYFNEISEMPEKVRKGLNVYNSQIDVNKQAEIKKNRENVLKVFPKYKFPEEKEKFEYAEGELALDPTILGSDHNRVKFIQHSIDTATAFLGTELYDNISKMLKQVGRLSDSCGSDSEVFDWMKLKKEYAMLHKKVDEYLKIKDQQSKKKELEGKELSNTAKRRVNAMSCLKDYLQQREAFITKYVAAEKKNMVDKDKTHEKANKLKNFNGKEFSDERFARWLAKEYVLGKINEGKKPRYVDEYNYTAKLLNSNKFKKFVVNLNKEMLTGKAVDFETAKKELFEKVNIDEIIGRKKTEEKQKGQSDPVLV